MAMSPVLLQLHDLLHVTPTTSATSTKTKMLDYHNSHKAGNLTDWT